MPNQEYAAQCREIMRLHNGGKGPAVRDLIHTVAERDDVSASNLAYALQSHRGRVGRHKKKVVTSPKIVSRKDEHFRVTPWHRQQAAAHALRMERSNPDP